LRGELFAPTVTWLLGLPLVATLPDAILVFLGILVFLEPCEMFEDMDPEASM